MTLRHIDDPPTLRFVLSGLFLLAAVGACLLGGWVSIVTYAQAKAAVEGQRNVIAAVGGRFTLDEDEYYIRELDLSDARVGDAWVRDHFRFWEYRTIRVLKVQRGQLSPACLNDLRGQQVDVVELSQE